jgi:hypothetical protein
VDLAVVVNVPAVENVWLNVAPGAIVLVPNEPSSAVTVWPVLSLFVQVTVEPTDTLIDAGWKEKSLMLTAAAEAAADGAGAAQGTALGRPALGTTAGGEAIGEGHGAGLPPAGMEAIEDCARAGVASSMTATYPQHPGRLGAHDPPTTVRLLQRMLDLASAKEIAKGPSGSLATIRRQPSPLELSGGGHSGDAVLRGRACHLLKRSVDRRD